MEKVGVVGCGLMGNGITKNLIRSGYEVYVHDINEQAVERLVNEGAFGTEDIKSMGEVVDYMILSLPSPKLIKELMLGQEGAIHSMKKGTFILDMSTNDVAVTRELYEQAKLKEIEFFDCPLSGGPDGAEDGTLTIMVGGDEKAFPSILPVLYAVGEYIEYIGESGAGQTVKLCHNMVVGGIITLLGEAFLTGEKAGVTKEKLAVILQKGSANTRVMDVFGSNILNSSFEDIKFSLANMRKDIHLYRNLAENKQIPTIASQSIHQIFQLANCKGKGTQDSTAVYEIMAELGNGLTVS
ncbi:NAD(P)-dependent oxidoreductase [Virgibacillus sp. FSP13]